MVRRAKKEGFSVSQEKSLCELLRMSKDQVEQIQAALVPFGLSLIVITDPGSQLPYVFFQKNGAITNFGINSHFHLAGFIFKDENESPLMLEARKIKATQEMRSNLENEELELEVFTPALLQALLDDLTNSSLVPEASTEGGLEEVKRDVLAYLQSVTSHTPYEIIDDNSHWSGDSNTDKYITSPIDIIMSWKDTTRIHENDETISMWGWEAPRKEKDPLTNVIPYGNVIGIVVIPNNTSLRERKAIAKSSLGWMKQYDVVHPSSMILTVDRNLLERWKQIGSPFISKDELEEHFEDEEGITPKKMEAHGYEFFRERTDPPLVTVDFWEPEIGSHIGSPQIRVNVKWDETYSDCILIDWGWIFSLWKSKNYHDFPAPSEGITEFLRKRLFRPTKRLYRTDLLINSLDATIISNLLAIIQSGKERTNTFSEFIALEIFHRLGQDGMQEMMKSSEKMGKYTLELLKTGGTTRLFKYLQRREKEVYAQKSNYHGLFITHAHQDHTLGSAIIRAEIPRYFTAITQAFLQTDFHTASRWLVAETAAARDYSADLIKGAHPVEEYPYELVEDGVRVEVAPGIFVTAYAGAHSIPGEVGFVWEIYHKGKLVSSGCYGGDDKDGHFYRRIQDHVRDVSPIDLAIIEGTNDERTAKRGAFTDENDVQAEFSKLLVKANHEDALLIVDLAKNNMVRLFNLVREGAAAERIIVLSPKIADRVYRLEQALSEKLASGYESADPVEQQFLDELKDFLYYFYSGNMKIWKRQGTNFKKYEKEMFEKFDTISVDDLSSYFIATDKKYLLIREMSESERKISGIASKNTYWVRSSTEAHDEGMREEIRRQAEFARNNHITYLPTGFHTSGHGVNVPSDHPEAEHGLLYEVAGAEPGGIVVAHTKKSREHINGLLKTYPQLQNTVIYEKLEKPNPIITPPEQFDRWRRGRK